MSERFDELAIRTTRNGWIANKYVNGHTYEYVFTSMNDLYDWVRDVLGVSLPSQANPEPPATALKDTYQVA